MQSMMIRMHLDYDWSSFEQTLSRTTGTGLGHHNDGHVNNDTVST